MNSYILNRRAILSAAVAAPVLPLLAGFAHAAKPAVFTDEGVAIRGYDPVAYFTQSAPVVGNAAYSAEYNGATWLLASAENQAMFEAQAEAFAPQYGGYCAYAGLQRWDSDHIT
jgi:YHS domain-containing protein